LKAVANIKGHSITLPTLHGLCPGLPRARILRHSLVVAGQISTLAALTDDKEAMKAVAEIQQAAKGQGLKRSENPFVLKLENN